MRRLHSRLLLLLILPASVSAQLDREGTLWRMLEWKVQGVEHDGNPFDLEAKVAFTHAETGEKRTTGIFYGGDAWRFRFTPTRTGTWKFRSESSVTALSDLTGTVTVSTGKASAHGFLVGHANRWAWQTGENGEVAVFVPQIVMGRDLPAYQDRTKIHEDIQRWFVEHGFNGIHVGVLCRWFDLDETSYDNLGDDPNPDPRTFEILEQLISAAHAAGGMVHLWAWGDESRNMTPHKWGLNGKVDRRLQRYIAARLGPLPGWSMGYGFDLWEWVEAKQLKDWHDYMHAHMGWAHLLGARSEKNKLTQLSEAMDYSSYEQHQPAYSKYLESLRKRPGKPVFSEDRFRVREPSPYPDKDYDLEITRRGLWHSALAGGVANIWGYLVPNALEGGSRPYPNREQIKTYSRFFEKRFLQGMKPHNDLTDHADGVSLQEGNLRACLADPQANRYIFYAENSEQVNMNLRHMVRSQGAVAVDALKPYKEIPLPEIKAGDQVWKAPYKSTWAIAVGEFP